MTLSEVTYKQQFPVAIIELLMCDLHWMTCTYSGLGYNTCVFSLSGSTQV